MNYILEIVWFFRACDYCKWQYALLHIFVVPEIPILLQLIVDHGCQVYMCDLSTHHLVISAHQFTYVKPTLLQCKHPVVYTNTMLYHGWIYELKTPWMCKWLATVWIGLWIQTKNSIFFFFKRDTPIWEACWMCIGWIAQLQHIWQSMMSKSVGVFYCLLAHVLHSALLVVQYRQ